MVSRAIAATSTRRQGIATMRLKPRSYNGAKSAFADCCRELVTIE